MPTAKKEADVAELAQMVDRSVVAISTSFYFAKLTGGDRVPNPINELTILIVGNFCGIHPESTDGNRAVSCTESKCRILITGTHMECTLRNVHHARRFGQSITASRSNSMHLAIIR